MKTLAKWLDAPPQIPLATVWLLADLAEYRGKQELFTRQSPQRLSKLREHALIESAVASNRIEGVEIERRYEDTTLPMGEKTDAVRRAVLGFAEAFHINELCKRCPDVSLDMVRKVLKTMRESKEVECLGRGKHALWRRIG